MEDWYTIYRMAELRREDMLKEAEKSRLFNRARQHEERLPLMKRSLLLRFIRAVLSRLLSGSGKLFIEVGLSLKRRADRLCYLENSMNGDAA